MDRTRQQAYDRGQTIFSPDGRLYQVEYAREAVARGSPSVGVRTADGVVLAARKRVRSPLLEPTSVEKIHRIDEGLAVASAGHAADARTLVDLARETSQRHRLRYGEPITASSLATAVADHVQEHTQTGGSRPFGTALLVAGVDGIQPDDPGRPGLYEVDPSGTATGWRAGAIGESSADLRRVLEDRLAGGRDGSASIDADRGVHVALEALAASTDEPLSAADLDVCTVSVAPPAVDRLSTATIDDALEAAS
ncbi:archaeal proteasome endopeptidase complex subunit alpha [Natronobeatus ordinarius]|uniref:archaeal proteasome endopeptidase complex subunit alpha n=1 Tax=Natronobeatus ordinarius TaxID=2963433 RepID=UPI0020CC93F5|nr:archaeal proteasome endopeptidase complex subunit alpha [Natronobeatus ordinarius]